jgi:hypothetical protein
LEAIIPQLNSLLLAPVNQSPVSTPAKDKKVSPRRRPSKCIKEKGGKVELVVGRDIAMGEISGYFGKTLVGRFNGKFAGVQALQGWMEKSWKSLLDYLPETFVLARGWNGFILKSHKDCEALLKKTGSGDPHLDSEGMDS